MTRQFEGTFTSSVENITAAVNDIHASAFETALMQDICPDMDKVYEAYANSLFENFYGERK